MSKADIYPRYCFHLSPTANTWCLFKASDIHALRQHAGFEGEGFFFYANLPIKWVRVIGVVVAIDEFAGRRVFTIDDSSGACIEVLCNVKTVAPPSGDDDKATVATEGTALPTPKVSTQGDEVPVGTVVDVKGALSIFRDEMQIKIEKMTTVRCTAHEVVLWKRRTTFRKDVLEKPWVLSDKAIRKCRKQEERTEEKTNKRLKRSEALTETCQAQSGTGTRAKTADNKSQRPARMNLKELIETGAVNGQYDALGL